MDNGLANLLALHDTEAHRDDGYKDAASLLNDFFTGIDITIETIESKR